MSTADCRIVRIESEVLDLELREPFGISGGSHDVARIVLVTLHCADGTFGLGEAAPLPAYNGERVEDVLAALERARPLLLGADGRAWRQRASDIAEGTEQSPSARCAIETALCDALARRGGLSLYHFFGGSTPAHLQSDVTIPIVDAARAQSSAEGWWQSGFRTLKIKVGMGEDLERIAAAHRGAPGAKLLLDANGGLDAEQAVDLVEALAARGIAIELFEQPVAASDWTGLARVAASVRVALDESVRTARDAVLASQRLGSPHVLNVKLMKSGIAESLDIIAVARATGMSLMIGGMVESVLAMSTSACLAAGQGGFEFVDLDTPLFLRDSPFEGGFSWQGARLDLSRIVLGHGVRRIGADRGVYNAGGSADTRRP
jgi:L-alanine-DL-glutamate epimerase-like enolase superfamily enzyme